MVNQAFRVTPVGNSTLQLVGELDLASAPLLKAALHDLKPDGSISLDLAELTFIDSAGLHALAQYAKSLNGQGPLVLANVPEWIAHLLQIVGFDNLETMDVRR